MPEYAYQCQDCGQTQPLRASVSSLPDWLACPQCGGLARRSGLWYNTIALHSASAHLGRNSDTPSADAPTPHVCYAGCALHHFDLDPALAEDVVP
jgi:putative FmdB family regulatory protein